MLNFFKSILQPEPQQQIDTLIDMIDRENVRLNAMLDAMPRARMIRQAGLEAVAKALDTPLS